MSLRIESSVVPWLIVAAAPALALTAGGCGEEFDSCVSTRTCPPPGKAGSGGSGGEAGSEEAPLGGSGNVGKGGGGSGTGGTSGDGGTTSGNGSTGDGGDGGRPEGAGTGGSNGSGEGESGSGGEGGDTVGPADPCESVTCEHGECANRDGVGVCACEQGFAGPACELPAFEWVELSPGHGTSVVHAILAANGTVVGASCCHGRDGPSGGLSEARGFRWTHEAGSSPALNGADIYDITGANQDGSVFVGTLYESAYVLRAFRWNESSGFVSLGVLPGGVANAKSYSRGVSADGSAVVGTSGEPFHWTAEAGMVQLALPSRRPAESSGEAFATSDDGSIIVGNLSYSSTSNVLRWTSGGQVEWIEPSRNASATGMSADGEVIVGGAVFAEVWEAFRWTRLRGIVSLGRPAGCSSASSTAVSGDGHVVAVSCSSAEGNRSYLWDVDGGFRRLEDILEGIGADVADAGTLSISHLSFDGSTVLGRSNRSDMAPWIARLPATRD